MILNKKNFIYILTIFIFFSFAPPTYSNDSAIHGALNLFQEHLKEAEKTGHQKAFATLLDHYLAPDAQITVNTQAGGIGGPPISHDKQMTKQAFLNQIKTSNRHLSDYKNSIDMHNVKILPNSNVATFTVHSRASGNMAVDASYPGLEDLSRSLDV